MPLAKIGDALIYTLTYTVEASVTNAIIDVLPEGVTYVDGTASSDAQFTFVDYRRREPDADLDGCRCVRNGTLTYDVDVIEGAAELESAAHQRGDDRLRRDGADDDDSPVFVPPVPLELTPPPTDALAPSATSSSPGFALMLVLLAIAGLALSIGFITPVPESVRRRDRLG